MQKVILILTLVILVFGLAVLSSAGIIEGQKKFGSSYYYLTHQLMFGVLPGLFLMFVLARIDHKIWKKLSLPILFGALLLTILVFVPPFGQGLKGATRWIVIAGYSLQPSELLKLGLIIYLAAWFGNRDERIRNWTYGAAPFFIVLAFIAALLIMQPDIGTLIIVTLISFALYFFAGSDMKHLFIIGIVIIAILAVSIVLKPYRWDRIKTFMDPSVDPKGISYQVNQTMISIGSGGMFGLGYGKSTQKFGFLPEVVNDSIFAVVVEEMGFVGAALMVTLYLLLIVAMVVAANRVSEKFGKLVILGVMTWIAGQALINIAAVSGMLPLTGIPLPLVSYGGTAIMSLMAGMGVVLNISRRA